MPELSWQSCFPSYIRGTAPLVSISRHTVFQTVPSALHCTNMKLVVLVSLVALAAAIPPRYTTKKPIRLLRYSFNQDGKGNYEYGYEQDNGQIIHEIGSSQPGPKPNTGTISKEGSYEYVGPDLQTYRIDYVAGEGGFQALGAHLPKAPAQLPEYAQLRQQYPELFVGSTL